MKQIKERHLNKNNYTPLKRTRNGSKMEAILKSKGAK